VLGKRVALHDQIPAESERSKKRSEFESAATSFFFFKNCRKTC
jgi:hypothetical protein